MSLSARGEEVLRELIRPHESIAEKLNSTEYPVVKLKFEGKYSELYVYQEALDAYGPGLEKKLISAAHYFDQVVCEDFKEILNIHPLFHSKTQKNGDRIILLFDHKLPYRGHHSRLLTQLYQRDFILIDTFENLETNYLRYRLPHELQHVVRYHFNENEEDWVNEGLSGIIEHLLSLEFPTKNLEKYKSFNEISLNDSFHKEGDNGIHYFNTFFYFYYLYQNFGGVELIKKLIQSPHSGIKNIEKVLGKEGKKNLALSQFYTFQKSFINYQLALKLNLFRKSIDSHGGFLELKLSEGNVPDEEQSYFVNSFVLPYNKAIALKPLSSKYYDVNQKCITLTLEEQSPLLAVLIDMHAPDPQKVIQIMESDRKFCVSDVMNSGQFVVVINPETERHPFILSNKK